ncbi:extracellular solute-binding protein [Faecalibacterium sp. An122]|uniref:ABC transporter substrate-binding protein n=1 Tax=Faecalibacterium sp. An122 TaxID=1965551 RepID=UPI000B38418B|nr:extracellular solute-binding protein [Faecalibacterium sp. An122]OUQ37587.1 sugar ABC transporter substrate-binding protein [Faecalibacterium sp. An122]
MSNAISRRDFLKVTGAVGAAGLLAACGGNGSSTAASTATSVAAPAEGDVSLTISWWGGDTRHTAYQEAITAFSEEHTNITVSPTFAAWSGWEDTMSTKFAGGVAEDVCQVNWNWLYNYSSNGQTFIDLNTVSDYIDLTQWDEGPLNACVVAGMQQAVPVSMTGRIFFWNMTTFNKAGITEVPKTLDDLYAAGETFQTKLGEDYYPLHLGGYDRMILTVFYLESIYGKDWADPSTSTLNYTADEIAEGLDFIKSLVDKHVIMPLPTYYGNNGSTAANQSNEWITGKLAGIFEWDSAASKYRDALDTDNRDGFTVGEEIQFGDYKGGFTKVSMGLAITKTCQHPAEAAMLINFLLNEEAGASIMGSECGIPASKSGLAAAEAAGAVDTLVEEANSKVLAFCSFQLDPLFEHNNLKADGTGIYQEVFDTIDYDGASGADVVDILLDGMESVGYTINA